MTKTINGCNELIYRLLSRVTSHQTVNGAVIGISEEDRFHIGIVHANVLHTVLLFVTTSQLMLLDDSVQIVLYVCRNYESVLSLAVHRLSVDVVHLLLVLLQPTLFLELGKVLGSLLIDLGVIFADAYGEINLRFDYMVQRFLVVTSLSASFFAVKHIVGTALHLFNEFNRWTKSLKRFYNSHSNYLFTWNLVIPSFR